jgi:hypothetical protein
MLRRLESRLSRACTQNTRRVRSLSSRTTCSDGGRDERGRRQRAIVKSVKLPASVHRLLWDCPPESVDPDRHAALVLERVLEYGSLATVRWALDAYGPDRIRQFLRARGARTLSRKTLSFWKVLLDLESDPCFETSSLRHSRPFWNY